MSRGGPRRIETLKSACEESREVLNHELSVQDDIDDKSIWSVRTAVIVLGLLLSAGSLGRLGEFLTLPWPIHLLAGAGVSFLLVSVFLGIGSYTMTETHPGLDEQDRIETIQSPPREEDWLLDRLIDYQTWIANQKAWNEQNGYFLFWTHVCLLLGTACVVFAGLIALFLSYQSLNGVFLGIGFAIPVLLGVLLLWKS